MKQILFLLTFNVCTLISLAQQNNTLKTIEQYCSLNVIPRLLSNKVNIDVDYGDPRKYFTFKNNRVRDDNGKAKKFNTAVEALNYMSTQGWKLVNAMAVMEGGTAVYRYILKRDIEVTEEEKKVLEEDSNKN
jgi:hypothetical protein